MKKRMRTGDQIRVSLAFNLGLSRDLAKTLSLNRAALRSALYRRLKAGEIEKVGKRGRVYFRLGHRGRQALEKQFPLSRLSRQRWDKQWRVAIFDIAEKDKKKRESLRRKLLGLGFGRLQDSVYLTPLDVLSELKVYLESQQLTSRVVILLAQSIYSLGPKAVADQVWRLSELNQEYEKLLLELEQVEGSEIGERTKRRLLDHYFRLVLRDPQLPRLFLPGDWLAEAVRRKVGQL